MVVHGFGGGKMLFLWIKVEWRPCRPPVNPLSTHCQPQHPTPVAFNHCRCWQAARAAVPRIWLRGGFRTWTVYLNNAAPHALKPVAPKCKRPWSPHGSNFRGTSPRGHSVAANLCSRVVSSVSRMGGMCGPPLPLQASDGSNLCATQGVGVGGGGVVNCDMSQKIQ